MDIGAWISVNLFRKQIMFLFNAFQMTALLIAWPFIISGLKTATFYGAPVLTVVACVVFVVHFIINIGMVYTAISEKR